MLISEPIPDKYVVTYHPSDAPWPHGIEQEVFEHCYSRNEAINLFIKLKGAELGERIIEVYPIYHCVESRLTNR